MYNDSELVRKFCSVCDAYSEDRPCRIAGETKQEVYALRNWCGWAVIDRVGAEVTLEEIKRNGQTTKRDGYQDTRKVQYEQ